MFSTLSYHVYVCNLKNLNLKHDKKSAAPVLVIFRFVQYLTAPSTFDLWPGLNIQHAHVILNFSTIWKPSSDHVCSQMTGSTSELFSSLPPCAMSTLAGCDATGWSFGEAWSKPATSPALADITGVEWNWKRGSTFFRQHYGRFF